MHAFELARDLDMSMYDAAVTVSGDGLFHEFVNGLMARADRERVCKFPVGIIPGGRVTCVVLVMLLLLNLSNIG